MSSMLLIGQLLYKCTRSILSPLFKDITTDLSLLSSIIVYLCPSFSTGTFPSINTQATFPPPKFFPDPLSPSSYGTFFPSFSFLNKFSTVAVSINHLLFCEPLYQNCFLKVFNNLCFAKFLGEFFFLEIFIH
uniref:Uncharacterized protein n=1 Tax=Rousettus aegyptiacus TaxID=9407 RepID=A0A7J8F1A7_ROUAE|nr:hypothetical protein HJG63_012339 [Rousettus aegyptiacus]